MQPNLPTDEAFDSSSMSKARPHSFFRPTEWLIVFILGTLMLVTGTLLLYQANANTLVSIPKQGGVHVEGIIGSPRFINPLLAVSDADNDLSTLVYAGLMTPSSDGTLVPELAKSYTISDDGRTYSFVLKDDLTFHDGTRLTTEDVAFTVKNAQDVLLKSPRMLNWDGVEVVVHSDTALDFVLPEPYAPFIENTTLGILPKHIWGELASDEFPFSQYNSTPIGSGPYQMVRVVRDTGGIPTRYELEAFDRYTLGTPHLTRLTFNLYKNSNELLDAYQKGAVDAIHSITHEKLDGLVEEKGKSAIQRAPYLRVFALFLNHNRQPLFLRDEVVKALRSTVPKQDIVSNVLGGYGSVLDGPFPPGLLDTGDAGSLTDKQNSGPSESQASLADHGLETARAILEKGGWQRGEDGVYEQETDESTLRLSLSLTTANTPELVQATELVAAAWRTLGAEVELKVFDPSDLTQSVIRPRRYDALLFGVVVGRELDLYAFWHSSQRNDPGLNIAQYADIDADSLLSKARAATSTETRMGYFREFDTLVQGSNSAIFLYSPDFIYLTRDAVQGVKFKHVTTPADRFAGVHEWYKETDRVWPFVEAIIQ